MYFQVLAFGLILVFSPCSVRNSVQDSLGFEKTGVSNKSKATNNFENLCSNLSLDLVGDYTADLNNTTPEFPSFGTIKVYNSQSEWTINEDISLRQYKSPYTVKDKTPLYLLHQQFRVYLQEV